MKYILAYILICFAISAQAGVVIPDRDDLGNTLMGSRVTHPGWQYQLLSFEITTCELGGFSELDHTGAEINRSVMSFYDSVGTELVQGGEETDAAFQVRLDANCKKTIVDWTPTFDYQLIGGQMRQQNAPSTGVNMWVIGVPAYPEVAGGTKVFINNLNLKYSANSESVVADGRAPKDLKYNDPAPGTNTLRYQFINDSLGMKHTTQISMEIFKP